MYIMILYAVFGFILINLYIYRLKLYLISTMVIQFFWIWLLQSVNKQLVEVNHDNIVIKYVWNWNIYKVKINTKKCDNHVLTILDENENVINDRVLAFLGPATDWHGQTVSADTFGCKQLILIHEDGSENIIE